MRYKIFLFFVLGGLSYLLYQLYHQPLSEIKQVSTFTYEHSHPAVRMYYSLKKYAKLYNIPEEYAFAIAYQETKYQGPLHLNYQWAQTSTHGAVGPMQIIPLYGKRYAKKYLGRDVTTEEISQDMDLNIQIAMLMLRDWKQRHGNWPMAFGAYNTGKPIVNQYALKVYNKEYIWIRR